MRKWLILLVSIVILFIVIKFIGTEFASQAFNERIKEQLLPNYNFTYGKLDLDFWQKKLNVEDFVLIPDSALQANPARRLYEFKVASFEIELASVYPILFEKRLSIEGVTIADPELVIKDYVTEDSRHFTTESFSILDLITQYVALFEVKALEVESASFQHQSEGFQLINDFTLEDINFFIRHFFVDSTFTKQNFLNAQSIELVINEETLFLNDQIHQINFDQIRLSTKDSLLTFKGLALRPVDENVLTDRSVIEKHYIYHIAVPEINLLGIDYEASYLKGEFDIAQVVLKNPLVHAQEKFQKEPKTSTKNSAILAILERFAPSLSIGEVLLENGKIDLDIHRFSGFDLNLNVDTFRIYDLKVDTVDWYFDHQNPPFSGLSIQLSDINEVFLGQERGFHLDNFYISSLDSTLFINNLVLQAKSEQLEFLQKVPELEVRGINYLEAMFGEPVKLSQLIVRQPSTILKKKGGSTKKDQSNGGPPLESFTRFLRRSKFPVVEAKNVLVEEGKFELDQTVAVDQYQLEAEGLYVRESLKSWKNLVDTFGIRIKNIGYTTDSLKLQLDGLSSNGTDHQLERIRLSTVFKEGELDSEIERINVFNTDLDSLIAMQVEFDSTVVFRPDVNLKLSVDPSNQDKVAGPHFPFQTDNIRVQNAWATVDFGNGTFFNVQKLDTNIDLDTATYDIWSIQTGPAFFSSEDLSHRIQIEGLAQIGTSSYQFDNLQLLPQYDTLEVLHPIVVPQLKVFNLDRSTLLKDKTIIADKITINRPESKISIRKKDPKVSKSHDPAGDLPMVQVDTLLINDAAVTWEQGDTFSLVVPSFDLMVNGVENHRDVFEITKLTEYYRTLQFKAKDSIRVRQPGWNSFFTAFNLEADTLCSFGLDELNFTLTPQKEKVRSTLFGLRAEGLKIEPLFSQNALLLDDFRIKQMDLAVTIPQLDSTASKKSKHYIDTHFDRLAVNDFNIETIDLRLQLERLINIHGLSIGIEELNLDSTVRWNQMDDTYGRLSLNLKEMAFQFGRYDEYNLCQSLHYESAEKRLVNKYIQVQPRYTNMEYSAMLDHRQDYFTVITDSMVVHDFSPQQLFEKPLDISKVSFHKARVFIFNDENNLPEERYQPLVQEEIKAIPYPFSLDSLTFDGQVIFRALPQGSDEISKVEINDINATVRGLSNQPETFESPVLLNGTGSLYDEANFAIQAIFDMNDTLNSYEVKGLVREFELPVLNQVLTPAARIQVNEGESQLIEFDMVANEDYAIGNMFFKYKKLRFQILPKNDQNKGNLGNTILTFWANRLVKSRNPSFLTKEVGTIYFERDKRKAFVNLTVKGLLSGLVSSVGMKNNRRELKKMGIDDLEALDYSKLFGEKGEK